jgi:hypothetical protein
MYFEFDILLFVGVFCILLSGAQNTPNKKNLRDSHDKDLQHKDSHDKDLQHKDSHDKDLQHKDSPDKDLHYKKLQGE